MGKKIIEIAEWIPVTEELPPRRKSVLITTKDGEVAEAQYRGNNGFRDIWDHYKGNRMLWDDEVFAWRIMPVSAKEEGIIHE